MSICFWNQFFMEGNLFLLSGFNIGFSINSNMLFVLDKLYASIVYAMNCETNNEPKINLSTPANVWSKIQIIDFHENVYI